MKIRLPHLIATLIAFPVVHLAVAILNTLAWSYPLSDVPLRYGLELLTLAALPFAILQRRFPTLNEVFTWGIPERIVAVLTLGIIWIMASELILRLARLIRNPPQRVSTNIRRSRLLIGALFLVIVVLLLIPRTSPPNADIRVEADESLGAMPDLARGFSQGGEGQMPQVGYFEQTIPYLRELGTTLVRIDHLYDYYGVLSFALDGSPVYRWDDLDRIVDAILASGAKPYMSLSYSPPAIAGDTVYAPPTDLAAWGELVYQTVHYYNIERGLDIRYWELWNEPNLKSFWVGSLEAYLELYAVTAQAVHRADPSAFVGGAATIPSLNPLLPSHFLPSREMVVALSEYAQAHDLPLDFVSWHVYDSDPAVVARSVDLHREWTSAFTPAPRLIISEWNWDGGSDPKLDNGETSAYIAAVIASLADTPLEQALFFEPIDGQDDWRGGWGMIRADGQIKAAYNTFRLISMLAGERLLTLSSHPDAGALAALSDDGIDVLLWYNSTDYPALEVKLTLTGMSEDCPATVEVQGVDADHGNPYAGTEASDLFAETLPVASDLSNSCQVTLSIPQNGIRLLHIPN